MLTDLQEINLIEIEKLLSDGPLPLVEIADKLNLSIDTLRNWQGYGLLHTHVKRGEYRIWTNTGRRLIFVEGVNWSEREILQGD